LRWVAGNFHGFRTHEIPSKVNAWLQAPKGDTRLQGLRETPTDRKAEGHVFPFLKNIPKIEASRLMVDVEKEIDRWNGKKPAQLRFPG
jgi:hypothetical protein